MIEITSISNNIVKETTKLHIKKYRNEYIIVEGKKAVDGAMEADLKIQHIFRQIKIY